MKNGYHSIRKKCHLIKGSLESSELILEARFCSSSSSSSISYSLSVIKRTYMNFPISLVSIEGKLKSVSQRPSLRENSNKLCLILLSEKQFKLCRHS